MLRGRAGGVSHFELWEEQIGLLNTDKVLGRAEGNMSLRQSSDSMISESIEPLLWFLPLFNLRCRKGAWRKQPKTLLPYSMRLCSPAIFVKFQDKTERGPGLSQIAVQVSRGGGGCTRIL